MFLFAVPLVGALISEILLIVLFAVIVWVALHIAFRVIANSVLGLICLWLFNTIFGLGIAYSLPVIIVTALFGIPAVFIMVLLRIFGVF